VRNSAQHPEELWQKLSQSNANLMLGVESAIQRVRYEIGKKFTNEDIDWHLDMGQKYQVPLLLLIIVAYPTETVEDFELTEEEKLKQNIMNEIPADFDDNYEKINIQFDDMKYLDNEYVEYVKRHIQGLFENFTPVLMKSKSNEEIAMNSPSRNKIVEIAQSAIPKSISFDFKLIEENKLEQMKDDPMDFAKFGFGIEDNKSINEKKDDDISSESLSTCDTSSSTKSIENENQQTIIEQSLKADDSFVKEIREIFTFKNCVFLSK
jgi:radical SAM superfamily enzyme YgiQ (UPF0313 family)